MLGRRFFNEKWKSMLPQHGVEVWPGYATSVAWYQSGLLLQIDTSSRVLRTTTLLDSINELGAQGGQELVKRKLVG